MHATVEYIRPLNLNPRDVTVITSGRDLQYLRGKRDAVFIFLDGWWVHLDVATADAIWAHQYLTPAGLVLEQTDMLRRNYVRAAHGLPESTEDDLRAYNPLNDRRPRSRAIDYVLVQRLKERGGSFLPGLNDRRRKVRNVRAFVPPVKVWLADE